MKYVKTYIMTRHLDCMRQFSGWVVEYVKTYIVTRHTNRLDEMVLMMGHKICFYGKIQIIILKLSLFSFLIQSTGKERS